MIDAAHHVAKASCINSQLRHLAEHVWNVMSVTQSQIVELGDDRGFCAEHVDSIHFVSSTHVVTILHRIADAGVSRNTMPSSANTRTSEMTFYK